MITLDIRRLQLFLLLVWRPCDVRNGQLELMSIREAWRASRIVYFDQPRGAKTMSAIYPPNGNKICGVDYRSYLEQTGCTLGEYVDTLLFSNPQCLLVAGHQGEHEFKEATDDNDVF